MKNLTYEKIKELSVGYVRASEDSDGLHFYKCTERQVAFWREVDPVFEGRANATTGVRIDFYTNSKTVKFALSKGKFEVYVDNLLRNQYIVGGEEYPEDKEITLDVCTPLREEVESARITIYFPSHAHGYIKSLSVDEDAYVKPYEYNGKMLLLGDSITQGFNSEFDSFSFAHQLSRALNKEPLIQAIGGITFREESIEPVMLDADLVIIALGTNDYTVLPTYEDLRGAVSPYFDKISKIYGGRKIFVISPIWRAKTGRPMGSFAECRNIIIEEADKRGFIHIDGLSLVPPIPSLFADEWLHPNALGFGFYGENLIRIMLEKLK